MYTNFKHSNTYYTRSGQGSAVVLLHGFLESSTMWHFIIPQLSEKHTVINIDLLGHGNSESVGYIHTIEEMRDQVKAVLDAENINSATFIGHSMGGYVVLAFAEKYNDRVEKLVLLNSSSVADSKERKENRDRAIALVKKNKDTFLSMTLSNLFAEKNREKLAKEIQELKKEAFKMTAQGIIASIEGMKIRKNRTPVLQKFSKPKYIITAIEDPIIPIDDVQKLAEKTGSTLHKIQGGHMSTIETPEELAEIIKEII